MALATPMPPATFPASVAPHARHERIRRAITNLVLLVAACGGDGPLPPVLDTEPFNGQVVAPVDTDFTRLFAVWSEPGRRDSVRIRADGSFTVHVSGTAPGELLIDGGANRDFHPFLFPFAADADRSITAVLVPLRWTVRDGVYRGQVVATSLDPVVDDAELGNAYLNVRQLTDPPELVFNFGTWPLDWFPATVVLDHRNSWKTITPQDSAAMWAVLDEMQAVFGRQMFVPGVADPEWWTDETPVHRPGVIRLSFRERIIGNAWVASDDVQREWSADLGAWASDGPYSALQVRHRRINGGWVLLGDLVDLGSQFPWRLVLVHEMLHILGVHHTARIPSPQGRPMRTQMPSEYDVAYIELLREVMLLEREYDTWYGMVPAVIGERRMILGLSALPSFLPRETLAH